MIIRKQTEASKEESKSPASLTNDSKTIAVELTEGELERARGGSRPIIVVC